MSAELHDRRRTPVFIHSELDDFGLDPYEFRIYCHFIRRVRRNGHPLRIQQIAETCLMSRSQVKRAIGTLFDRRLILKESRNGTTSIYILTDQEEWISKPSTEPTDRVLTEPTDRVLSEPTDRVLSEPTDRVLSEPTPGSHRTDMK